MANFGISDKMNSFASDRNDQAEALLAGIKNPLGNAPKQKNSKLSKFVAGDQDFSISNALRATGLGTPYKYYFAVKGAEKNGEVAYDSQRSPGPISSASLSNFADNDNASGGIPAIFLDIPPQSINITTPFAVSVIATNKGILEENNGVVFKTITIAGTTGVMPKSRESEGNRGGPLKNSGTLISTLFPEAVNSVNAVAGSIGKLTKSITGTDVINGGDDGILGKNPKDTGFAKFWRLHNFLMTYADLKKSRIHSNLRLVFGSPKDGIEYVCTPLQFEMRRDAARPLQYQYVIVLKAWGIARANLGQDASEELTKEQIPDPSSPNAIKQLTTSLLNARDVVVKSRNVLQGINNDIQSVLNAGAQGVFVLKELVGLQSDINDFTTFFANNIDRTLGGAWSQLQAAIAQRNESGDDKIKRILGGEAPTESSSEIASAVAGGIVVTAGTGAIIALGAAGLSAAGIGLKVSPGGETSDPNTSTTNPSLLAGKKAFTAALSDPSIGGQILTDDITLPQSLYEELEKQKEAARNITSGDVRDLAANFKSTMDNLAQSIGMMDAQYAQTYGLPAPVTGRAPTEDDIILMASLNDFREGFTSTLATGQIFNEVNPDPFVSANNSLQDDEQLSAPNSSVITRVLDGEDLPMIAYRTLGDALRWPEIAILNDLKAPFIEAQKRSKVYLAPSGRTVLVSDTEGLAMGQSVTIVGQTSTNRKILNIENLDSSYRITFDGPDNLGSFVASPVKKLLFNTPGTISSGDPILIPSELIAEDPVSIRPTSLMAKISDAEKVFKVDIKTNDSGDLVVGADGDLVRSYGYDNAVQALKLALSVERSELQRHPSYGVAVPVGRRNSDVAISDLEAAVFNQISSDPRFSGATVDVRVDGSKVTINILAVGAEGTGAIPLQFQVGLDPNAQG